MTEQVQREPPPVFYSPSTLPMNSPGAWVVSGYDDIRAAIGGLIDRFEGKGEADLAYDFGRIYPVRVFMKLMGFPPEKLEEFLARRELRIALHDVLARLPPFRLKAAAPETVVPGLLAQPRLSVIWDNPT